MNCKWAEGYLSACLDGTLDPAVRDEVEAHVATCSHCSDILADYRHFDGLVRDLPRYEPAPALKDRLFNSPEFAAITRSLDDITDDAGERHTPTARPYLLSRPLSKGRGGPAAHDRALTPLPLTPRAAGSSETPPASGANDSGTRAERTGPPAWVRTAVAAAVVAVVFGSVLLWWQGRPHTGQTTNTGPISNIGGYHGGTPLPAGSRVVYAHDGTLWSAPEQGTAAAQRLTPPGVVVGDGWAVAPVRGNAGGDLVAYIDLKTGALHIIRSDNQRDRVLSQSLVPAKLASAAFWATPEGHAILGSITWAPDGQHLTALADVTGTGRISLAVFNAGGTAAHTISNTVVTTVAPVWSADGMRVAFAQASGAGQAVAEYNTASDQFKQISAAEPDGAANAVVRALGWLTSQGQPVLTWAASDAAGGDIASLYAQPVLQDAAAQRLVPAGMDFSVAAFAAGQNGGLWLLGGGGALSSVSVPSGMLTQLALVAGGVSVIAWSSDGSTAAVLSGAGALQVWNTTTGLTPVASGVAAQSGIAWAPDGGHLAFVASGQVMIASVNASTAGPPAMVAGLSGATALAWAPDGQRLAVATPSGVALASPDGSSSQRVDAKAATGGLVWSVVR